MAADLTNLLHSATDYATFSPGQVVFEEGHPGDKMYVVLDGQVEIRVKGTVVETLDTGGILGEMALIDAQLRSATAVARTQARLVPIDEKRFNFLVQEHPYFAIHVMRTMADRLRHMNAQVF